MEWSLKTILKKLQAKFSKLPEEFPEELLKEFHMELYWEFAMELLEIFKIELLMEFKKNFWSHT